MDAELSNVSEMRHTVYIGRPSVFGNKFIIGRHGDRDEVIEKYRVYFNNRVAKDSKFLKQVLALDGEVLGCFCTPKPCHGDVIVYFLKRYRVGMKNKNKAVKDLRKKKKKKTGKTLPPKPKTPKAKKVKKKYKFKMSKVKFAACVKDYCNFSDAIKDMSNDKDEIRDTLKNVIGERGEEDEEGNLYVDIVEGFTSGVRRTRTTSFTADAEKILKKKGLLNKATNKVLSKDKVEGLFHDGLLSKKEIDKIIGVKVNYAIDVKRNK